jgi:hypothetical protein
LVPLRTSNDFGFPGKRTIFRVLYQINLPSLTTLDSNAAGNVPLEEFGTTGTDSTYDGDETRLTPTSMLGSLQKAVQGVLRSLATNPLMLVGHNSVGHLTSRENVPIVVLGISIIHKATKILLLTKLGELVGDAEFD